MGRVRVRVVLGEAVGLGANTNTSHPNLRVQCMHFPIAFHVYEITPSAGPVI